MITVRLKGGMGNQMFQYAFGRALALRNNDSLTLDLAPLLDRTPRPNFVFRGYDLDLFNINARLTFFSRAALRFPIPIVWAGKSVTLTFLKTIFGRQRFIRESSDLDFESLPRHGDIYLDGAWQSEKYFASIAPTIRKEFTLRKPLSEKTGTFFAEVKSQNAICVNVRRGDFVTVQRSIDRHGFVGLEYYEKGMAMICETVKNPHAYIFSDDIAWCKENLKFPGVATTYVGHECAGEKFGEYLALMSICKHFLIPNSTFGWWAAWLAPNRDKLVVAPKQWFASGADDRGVVPVSWLRV